MHGALCKFGHPLPFSAQKKEVLTSDDQHQNIGHSLCPGRCFPHCGRGEGDEISPHSPACQCTENPSPAPQNLVKRRLSVCHWVSGKCVCGCSPLQKKLGLTEFHHWYKEIYCWIFVLKLLTDVLKAVHYKCYFYGAGGATLVQNTACQHPAPFLSLLAHLGTAKPALLLCKRQFWRSAWESEPQRTGAGEPEVSSVKEESANSKAL